MKLVAICLVLASALAAIGVACGPEEPYCYDQHAPCAEAKIHLDQIEHDRQVKAAAAAADAGLTDTGTIVFD